MRGPCSTSGASRAEGEKQVIQQAEMNEMTPMQETRKVAEIGLEDCILDMAWSHSASISLSYS